MQSNKLAGLEEIICRRRPALLPEFVPELALMAGEPTPGVRATLAGLAAEAAAVAARALPPGPPAAGVAAECARLLAVLVKDATPSVAKRAAAGAAGAVGDVARTAAGTADGAGSYNHAGGGDPQPALVAASTAWAAAEELNAALLAVVGGEGGSGAGARAAAIKAAEGAALALDALSRAVRGHGGGASTPTAADAARVAGETGAALASLLKGAAGLPGTVAIAAVKAACALAAGGAPPLAGRILPALTALASADARAGAAGASLRAALKIALTSLYTSPSAGLGAWRAKVGSALAVMGGVVDASDAGGGGGGTRPADGEPEGVPPAKRVRTEDGGGGGGETAAPPDAPTDPRLRAPMAADAGPGPPPPATAAAPDAAEAALPPPGSWIVPAGLHPEIRTALARAAHLAALDGSPFAPAVGVFIASLPPALVADAVLECSRTLPATALSGLLGPGGLNALGAELVAAALRPPPVAAPARPPSTTARPGRWDVSGGARGPPPPHQATASPGSEFGIYADLVLKALEKKEAAKAAKKEECGAGDNAMQGGEGGTPKAEQPDTPPTTLPLPPPLPPAPPAFPLIAIDMDARARREARRGAFARLIGRGGGGEGREFRVAALGRLAAGEQAGEGLGDALLEHLAAAAEGGRALAATPAGAELALTWLTALAVGEVDAAAAAAPAAAAPAAAPSHPPALLPSDGRYATTLAAILSTVRDAVDAAGGDPSKALEGVLLGAPHLPPGVVGSFLAGAIAAGGALATAAMTAAHAVAVGRPPASAEALGAVLAAATDAGASEDVRSKAVRLAANRLVRDASLAGPVIAAAEAGLWSATKDWVKGGVEEDGAAEAEEATAEAEGGGEGEEAAAAAPAPAAPTPPPPAAPAVELYCALVTRRPDLLPGLLTAFGAAPPGAPGRAAVMRLADGLARVLGPGSGALVAAAAAAPPPGSAPLLLKLLYVATEGAPASAALASALLARHAAAPDARLLPPALGGLPRGQALGLLPQVLALRDAPLRAALHRLLLAGPGQAPGAPPARHVPPAELLSAIMTTDPGAIPGGGGLGRLKAAVGACLAQPAIFDVAALSACLTHLAKRGTAELRPPPGVPPAPLPLTTTTLPLPALFMRLLMQALAAAPALRPLVVNLLAATAGRRPALWEAEPAQWKGWLLAARVAAPDAFAVLVALPGPVLAGALRDPDAGAALRAPVTDYARSASCPVRVAPDVLEALSVVEAEAREARMKMG